jgi:hypothetical protein
MRIANSTNFKNDSLYETRVLANIRKSDDDQIVLFNDKDKVKFIKTLEKIIRSSMEYKDYIKYLKEVIDMNKCSFFNNVTNRHIKHRVSIELHHEPFTLFDICQIVLEKHISDIGVVNPFKISEEVMRLHYQNKIGLIPLSVTVHELVTSGKLPIPLQCVYGDYVKFLEEYKQFIPENLNDMLYIKLQVSKEINRDMSILEKKYIYLTSEIEVEKI